MKYLFLVIAVVLPLGACTSDEGQSLGGRYYLENRDDSHVYIYKRTASKHNTVVVDQQVVDYEVVRGYLLVLRKVAESPDCYDKKGVPTIITHYSDNDEYWIINVNTEKEIGPLDGRDYFQAGQKLGLPRLKLRAPSTFTPNTEQFRKLSQDCQRLD
jgi:hypothetical protein